MDSVTIPENKSPKNYSVDVLNSAKDVINTVKEDKKLSSPEQSVDKLRDVDGSEILITLNTDEASDSGDEVLEISENSKNVEKTTEKCLNASKSGNNDQNENSLEEKRAQNALEKGKAERNAVNTKENNPKAAAAKTDEKDWRKPNVIEKKEPTIIDLSENDDDIREYPKISQPVKTTSLLEKVIENGVKQISVITSAKNIASNTNLITPLSSSSQLSNTRTLSSNMTTACSKDSSILQNKLQQLSPVVSPQNVLLALNTQPVVLQPAQPPPVNVPTSNAVLLSFNLAGSGTNYVPLTTVNLPSVQTTTTPILSSVSQQQYTSVGTSTMMTMPFTQVLGGNNPNISTKISMSQKSLLSPGSKPIITVSSSQTIRQLTENKVSQPDMQKPTEVTKPSSSIGQMEEIKRELLCESNSMISSFKNLRMLRVKGRNDLVVKPDSELGPLASFLNNLGLDVVKHAVYQEAIHIQSKKKAFGKLSDVECNQLEKMKHSCKELGEDLKHLKLNFKKCKFCKFVSESMNVQFWHKEHPHIDSRENLLCSYCDFSTRHNLAFCFHMEAEHGVKGRDIQRYSFWRCNLCSFEHNSKNKLTRHKWQCEKYFNLKTHLCPTSQTDINYCLQDIFYKRSKEDNVIKIPNIKPKVTPLTGTKWSINNKVTSIQPKLSTTTNQRIPVLVHPKNIMLQTLSDKIRTVGSSGIATAGMAYRQTTPNLSNLITTSGTKNKAKSMKSTLPVKDLITLQQQLKSQGSNLTARCIKSNQKPVPPSNDVSGFEICELCGGYVKDRDALRIHFFYAHRVEMPTIMFEKTNPPLHCDVCGKRYWTAQGLQKHRVSLKHYAKGSLSQVCILCGCLVSHLLNHMTETHQLNLQDFLNQKRCIVCGKVCQNRSDTEIHMAASHGILVKRGNSNSSEKSSTKTAAAATAITTTAADIKSTPKTTIHTKKPGTSSSTSQLVKGNYCVFCKIPFTSNAELTQHCLLVHKACKKCGMVLPSDDALSKHKCQISITAVKKCSVCKEEILIQEFIKHVELKHLKKCSIKLQRLSNDDIDTGTKKRKEDVIRPTRRLSEDASSRKKIVNVRRHSENAVVENAIKSYKRKLDVDNESDKESTSDSKENKNDTHTEGNNKKVKRTELQKGTNSPKPMMML